MKTKAFSLLEMILYTTLMSLLLFAISSVAAVMFDSRIKNQVIAEVEQQGLQIMQNITQTVRDAEGITSPVAGANAASMTLDVITGANDPTVYALSSGVVQITEGVGSAVDLNSGRVTVSGLDFHNLTKTDTPGIVRISFTVTHINPASNQNYNYSQTFYGSASIKQQ